MLLVDEPHPPHYSARRAHSVVLSRVNVGEMSAAVRKSAKQAHDCDPNWRLPMRQRALRR